MNNTSKFLGIDIFCLLLGVVASVRGGIVKRERNERRKVRQMMLEEYKYDLEDFDD